MYSKLCPVDELRPGEIKGLEIQSIPILVVIQDGVRCYYDRCSHQDVKLSDFGAIIDNGIVCYAHGARFCPLTGKELCEPAKDPLLSIPSKVEAGFLWVDISRYKNG